MNIFEKYKTIRQWFEVNKEAKKDDVYFKIAEVLLRDLSNSLDNLKQLQETLGERPWAVFSNEGNVHYATKVQVLLEPLSYITTCLQTPKEAVLNLHDVCRDNVLKSNSRIMNTTDPSRNIANVVFLQVSRDVYNTINEVVKQQAQA